MANPLYKEFDLVIIGGGIVGTWVAKKALKHNLRIAVVEIGPASSINLPDSKPAIKFNERVNMGANEARNQVLTGNSKYWGGGLISNNANSLMNILGLNNQDKIVNEILSEYENVQKELNVGNIIREDISQLTGNETKLASVQVLSGKKRHLWRNFYKNNSSNELLNIFTKANIIDIQVTNDKVEYLKLLLTSNEIILIKSNCYLLSAGVIDSNLFVQKYFNENISYNYNGLGKGLHDHWSINIAKVIWNKDTFFSTLYPLKFVKGKIIGKRIELVSKYDNKTKGFLHLQANYDEIEPYNSIKSLLFNFDKSLISIIKVIIHLLKYFPQLIKIGWFRYAKKELYISKGTVINLVLDFESVSDELNKIKYSNSKADLNWNVRENDINNFLDFYFQAKNIFDNVIENKQMLYFVSNNKTELKKYFCENVIDAYHLGGGIPISKYVNYNFTFSNLNNFYILGTAIFNRPGIANPVLTLLALGNIFIKNITSNKN